MQTFHIRYRNTQGTLLRILNAASRRGLDIPWVKAEPAESDHHVSLELGVNPKQAGQLFREWYAIADVIEVRAMDGRPADVRPGAAFREHEAGKLTWGPHPPASETSSGESTRSALV